MPPWTLLDFLTKTSDQRSISKLYQDPQENALWISCNLHVLEAHSHQRKVLGLLLTSSPPKILNKGKGRDVDGWQTTCLACARPSFHPHHCKTQNETKNKDRSFPNRPSVREGTLKEGGGWDHTSSTSKWHGFSSDKVLAPHFNVNVEVSLVHV